MVEKQVIVSGIEISHTGLFSVKDIEQNLTKYIEKKGYVLNDKTHDIIADPNAAKHTIIFTFSKKTSQYDTSIFKAKVCFENMTKSHALRNDIKIVCDKGKVTILFTGLSKSLKEGFVGYTPFRYFFTFLRSKFITKKYDDIPGAGLDADIKDVYDEVHLYIKHTDLKEISEDTDVS